MNQTMMLYSNDNIDVIYNKGTSKFLLITFTSMNFQPKDDLDYFCRTPAQKLSINCIGIVAKQNHWFPHSFMADTIPIIKEYCQKFNIIITYGSSMGGYAALKYSKIFNANKVIAYMPQATINPKYFDDNRYLKEYTNYKDLLVDDLITIDDIFGQCFLFYDKYDFFDNIHANYLMDIYNKNITLIRTPFTGHTLGHILIGSDFLNSLLEFTLTHQDEYTFLKLVQKKVYAHPFRYQNIIKKATEKHYKLIFSILKNAPAQSIIFHNPIFKNELISLLSHISKNNFSSDIINILFKAKNLDQNIIKYILSRNFQSLIKTDHDNYLYFDLLSSSIKSDSFNNIYKDLFKIPLSFKNDYGILSIDINNQLIPITYENKKYFLGDRSYTNIFPFLVYRKINDFFIITNGLFNATATPKNTLDFGKTHIKDWEKFHMVSMV